MGYAEYVVKELRRTLAPLADTDVADGARAYMKNIAPFLGVRTPQRRATAKSLFKTLDPPDSDTLGHTARLLYAQQHREFAYCANDMIAFFIKCADEDFLEQHVQDLLVTKPWWDTVDGLGSSAISPLTIKFPNMRLIETWNSSDNMWLARAAIQHQRGRRSETDVDYVLEICARHSESREFFITKAVGWALRDIAAFNKPAVRRYVKEHPELHRVTTREAERGLNR